MTLLLLSLGMLCLLISLVFQIGVVRQCRREKQQTGHDGIVEGDSRQNRWRKKNKAAVAAYMRDYRAKKKGKQDS